MRTTHGPVIAAGLAALREFADTAALKASDQGSGITASIVNVNSNLTAH